MIFCSRELEKLGNGSISEGEKGIFQTKSKFALSTREQSTFSRPVWAIFQILTPRCLALWGSFVLPGKEHFEREDLEKVQKLRKIDCELESLLHAAQSLRFNKHLHCLEGTE